MDRIKYGVMHTHTDGSVKDSALKPKVLCERAHELGAPAVVLTDHGVLTRVFEFMKSAENVGIKGIPGVEAYVREDEDLLRRSHLILIAKNIDGYRAICKAVTKSNTRIRDGVPRMNQDILSKCFGPKSSGHGNVIATSACISGILAQILLKNNKLEEQKDKIAKRMDKLSDPNDPAYLSNRKLLLEIGDKVKGMAAERDSLNKIANKKYAAKERKVNALKEKNSADYETERAKLDREIEETKRAEEKVTKIKLDIAKLKRQETAVRKQCTAAEKTHDQWRKYQSTMDKLDASKRAETELYEETKDKAKELSSLFGEGNFFIELQYHGLDDEKIAMPLLAKIAGALSLPTVASNDVHFARKSYEDIRARQLVRSLRFNKFEAKYTGDDEYYIKTDAELEESLNIILTTEETKKAMLGIQYIVEQCNVEFPKETHFPAFASNGGETAKVTLRRLCEEGIKTKFPNGKWTKVYQERMEYELKVIEDLGYCDYLCIVEDFLRYGRKLGTANPDGVGLGVGPGRGSAVGSLVCYLVGITGIDPLQYGLLFERFLNRDRVSFPDIDSDFCTDIRQDVINYVKEKYGEEAVCNILTQGTLAARAAVRNAARILGDEKYSDTKALLSTGDAIAKAIPPTVGMKLEDVEAELRDTFKTDKDALAIIDDAKLIEGTVIQYGMHAAGVIIADNGHVGDYVPLMYNEDNEQWMCQCTMKEAENDAGLLKMDFLGLRNLDIITEAIRLIKQNRGISIDIEEVGRSLIDGRTTKYDVTGNVFDDIFAKGKTNAVFQFESSGMKGMLKKFRPSNIDDIVLLIACYRPGPMQYIDDIIQIKRGKKKPAYIVPEMEEILGNTYGHPVYQESVMQIFNKVAGFSLGESDIIRRAMSKKKEKELEKYHDKFIDGLKAAGANETDAEQLWKQLSKFSAYAFNKSHACAYAFVAYYTAWLKLNYPAEYMTAVLNHTPVDKYPKFIPECAELGISVLPPDINKSGFGFVCQGNEILFGLGAIKNVKNAADTILEQRKKSPFRSYKDFIMRGHTKKDVTEALIESGALDKWCSNRTAMKSVLESMATDYKKAMDKLNIVENEKERLSTLANEKEREKARKKIDSTEIKYQEYISRFNRSMIPVAMSESKLERLEKEHDLLGMYVSGHPLDEYEDIKKYRTCTIAEAVDGENTLSGMIRDLRLTQRKKDGAPMAFFKLTDETGDIDVCCFTKAFAENKDSIANGNVVSIKGKCVTEESLFDDDDIIKLYTQKITPVKRTLQKVIISVKDMMDWADRVYDVITEYAGDDYALIVHDKMTGEFRQTIGITVNEALLEADIPDCDIELLSLKERAA